MLIITETLLLSTSAIPEKIFPQRQFQNGFVGDTTRVIVDWIKKDTTVSDDVSRTWSNPGSIFLEYDNVASQSSAPAPVAGVSGSMARFTLLNDYLYTVTDNNLNVFNITTPENPVFANTIDLGWASRLFTRLKITFL